MDNNFNSDMVEKLLFCWINKYIPEERHKSFYHGACLLDISAVIGEICFIDIIIIPCEDSMVFCDRPTAKKIKKFAKKCANYFMDGR